MHLFDTVQQNLVDNPKRWLVTGTAGFIGSNLLEKLLKLGQVVVGLDNLSTGKKENLLQVREMVTPEQWAGFTFIEDTICNPAACHKACSGIDYVLHQAALGSVPRSVEKPIPSNEANVSGTLNMLVAAKDCGAKRFVFASSSSVYGDHPALPKVEDTIGTPLSPYAVTKLVDELYASQFARHYGLATIGLRYFNVFGPRQDPEGAYAAVIPKWISAMITGQQIYINGTGETSRDFCFVQNVVQANLLAATTEDPAALDQIYNVALNSRITLNGLFETLRTRLLPHCPHLADYKPEYRDFRAGDVMHSQADIGKARTLLGYQPDHTLEQGVDVALEWYRRFC